MYISYHKLYFFLYIYIMRIKNIKIFLLDKKNLLSFFLILFIFGLLIFSTNNISAAKNGLLLWANNIVPSLFPFFIATELLAYTNLIPLMEKLLDKLMRPLFNVPGSRCFSVFNGYDKSVTLLVQKLLLI